MAATRFRGRGHITNGPLGVRPADGWNAWRKSGDKTRLGRLSVLLPGAHRPARDFGEPEREGAQPCGFR
jgi:hypothetical protein